MSQKRTKLKHEMFRDTAIYRSYTRLLDGGFDRDAIQKTVNRVNAKLAQDPANLRDGGRLADSGGALLKELSLPFAKGMHRYALKDSIKMYQHMDAWLAALYCIYNAPGNDPKDMRSYVEGIRGIVKEYNYPGFEPLGDEAPAKFDEFLLGHLELVRSTVYWISAGKYIYKVSRGLTEQLMNSKLDNYPTDNIRLPQTTLYVAPPAGYFNRHVVSGENTATYGIENSVTDGILLSDAKEQHDMRVIGFSIMGTANARSGATVLSTGFTMGLALPKGGVFKNALLVDTRNGRPLETAALTTGMGEFIAGVCVYLTLKDADDILATDSPEYAQWVKELRSMRNKAARKVKRQLRNVEVTATRYLGQSVPVIDRHREVNNVKTGSAHAPPVMHHRAGHFRAQPFGPRENPEYKTIWIRPQVIGAHAAPAGPPDVPARVRVVR